VLLAAFVPLCVGGEGKGCPSKDKGADDLVKAGRTLARGRQLVEAKACYKKAVETNPRYVPGLLELGTAESQDGNFQAAIKHFSAALKQEVTSPALNNLAIAYQSIGAHADAVAAYKRVIKIDEDDDKAFYNLGTALEKAGEFKDAAKAYRQAIEIEPEEAKYYNNLGGCLAASNRTDTAEKSYKWAIKLDKRFVDAYYNLGNFLLGIGRIEEAIERLQVTLKIRPDHAKAEKKLSDANKALEEKVAAFKEEIDNAIEKAEGMRRRGEL